MADLPWLTHDDFAGRVGEPFDVRLDEQRSVGLELAETSVGADEGGRGPDGETRTQFSLVFRGPEDQLLPQGTYSLRHADLGELLLFLVPLGPEEGSMRYEAAFA